MGNTFLLGQNIQRSAVKSVPLFPGHLHSFRVSASPSFLPLLLPHSADMPGRDSWGIRPHNWAVVRSLVYVVCRWPLLHEFFSSREWRQLLFTTSHQFPFGSVGWGSWSWQEQWKFHTQQVTHSAPVMSSFLCGGLTAHISRHKITLMGCFFLK